MDGFGLNSLHECERIIGAEDIFLETSRTGEHYQLSRFHTNTCYRLSLAIGIGGNREVFSRRLVDETEESHIDVGEINVLVATGIDAVLLAGTLQHFRAFKKQPRLTYVYERNGVLALREGFVFEKDEKVLVIHVAAIRFQRIAWTIDLIQRSVSDLGQQPCVEGFMVLLDRSPMGLDWRTPLCAYKSVIGVRKPIDPFPTNPKMCPLCIQGIPLGDLSETA